MAEEDEPDSDPSLSSSVISFLIESFSSASLAFKALSVSELCEKSATFSANSLFFVFLAAGVVSRLSQVGNLALFFPVDCQIENKIK